MLEAGIDGGNGVACPGHYVGIEGALGGAAVCVRQRGQLPLSWTWPGTTSRVGASVRFGRSGWIVRPAVRSGLAYDGDELSHTVGASLTLAGGTADASSSTASPGREGPALVLIQIGGVHLVLSAGDLLLCQNSALLK